LAKLSTIAQNYFARGLLAEAMKLKKKMPGSVFVGTKGETDRLRHLLAAVGLKASISKTVT
jgi:hypothetical protein